MPQRLIEIREIPPTDVEVRALFALLDAHNTSFCPPEVCHLTQPEELMQADSVLLGVFCDGRLCGMGGLKYYSDYGEVTRMFIKEEFRGKGLATMLMDKLTEKALNRKLTVLKLETSEKFKMAVQLYLKLGFERCEPFGEYVTKPHNLYLLKNIVE